MRTILWYIVVLLIGTIDSSELEDNSNTCENITGECADQGYTHTKIDWANSNSFSSQQAADATIKSYEMLTPCSKYLKIFLCAAYKPSCYATEGRRSAATANHLLVRPCRSMCTHVYSRCYPLMEKFKRPWSAELNCSRFLDDSSHRCMRDPDGYIQDSIPDAAAVPSPFHAIDSLFTSPPPSIRNISSARKAANRHPLKSRKVVCVGDDGKIEINGSKCYLRCDYHIEFSPTQKQISRLIDLVLNVLSLLTCSSSILVYLIRKNKTYSFLIDSFFYSSISIIGYSLTQIVALTLGVESLACENKIQSKNRPIMVYSNQPFENPFCSATLLFTYYFSSTLLSRWLTLSLFWYVWVKRQIDPVELGQALKNYLNALALIAPGIQTFVLLALHYAEVFELSGLCSLGVKDVDMALKFIVLPSSAYSIAGLLFVLAGFKAILVLKLRDHFKQFSKFASDHNVMQKGFLVFLSSIPILAIFGCQLWEYVLIEEHRNEEPTLKLGVFLAKNLLYFLNSVFILVVTCRSFSTINQRQNLSQPSTLYDTNETNVTLDSSSSSFEKKLTYTDQILNQTEPRNMVRGKCACQANKAAFNRAILNANRSVTLCESFIRMPETPVNEHHYCTPNLTAYECIVNSKSSTWQKYSNTYSKLVVQEKNKDRVIKLNENRIQDSKFV